LVVLEQERHQKRCAHVVIKLSAPDAVWCEGKRPAAGSQPPTPTHARVLASLPIEVELLRGHAQKKLAASSKPSQFSTTAAWAV
jgi:hypothetical protein